MRFPPLYREWLVVPSGQYMYVRHFGFLCHCWMAIDGRWCCWTTVGLSDVARIMQWLRVVARRLDMSPIVVSRLWRIYQETGEYTRNRVNADPG